MDVAYDRDSVALVIVLPALALYADLHRADCGGWIRNVLVWMTSGLATAIVAHLAYDVSNEMVSRRIRGIDLVDGG